MYQQGNTTGAPAVNYSQGYGYGQPGAGAYGAAGAGAGNAAGAAAPATTAPTYGHYGRPAQYGGGHYNAYGGYGRGMGYSRGAMGYRGGYRGGMYPPRRRRRQFVGGSLETQRQWERANLCCFHAQGNCRFGDRCRFSHEDDGKRRCHFGLSCRVGHATRPGINGEAAAEAAAAAAGEPAPENIVAAPAAAAPAAAAPAAPTA